MSRIEILIENWLENGDLSNFVPQTKIEKYFIRMINKENASDLTPQNRLELLLSALANNLSNGSGSSGGSSSASKVYVEKITGELIELLGTYDGSSIEITENGIVDIESLLKQSKLPLSINFNKQGGGSAVEGDMLQAKVDATNSCRYLFYYYSGDNVDYIANLDTSNVTDMYSMFNRCQNLTSIPQLDTSKVTNMDSMFYNCSSLKEIPQLDTSNVTEVYSCFNGCTQLITIPPLDTKKVISMQKMFYNCTQLITISQLDMINVNGAPNMFDGCKNLTNLTLLNIQHNLQVGSGTTYGHLLTVDSLVGLCKECIKQSGTRTLTIGTANLEKLASVYVKFTDSSVTEIARFEKGDVVVCESTDEGAMLISEYMTMKSWTLA